MEKYIEISVATTTEGSELVAYFLEEASPLGVSIFDAQDFLNNSSAWDYATENILEGYHNRVTVKGYCKKEDAEAVLSLLSENFENLDRKVFGSLEISTNEVDGDLWLQKWKESFSPIEIGDFVICPEWIEVDSKFRSQKVLKLDSGIAFGTGQHETTRMCLLLLSKLSLKGKTVADIGCGSGILGLCALLKDAQSAVLIDNDKQATDVTLRNAELNGLSDKCRIQNGNLLENVGQAFDLILANLTAEILYILAEDISKIVKEGSILILSGILNDRVDKVKHCFAEKGFKLVEEISDSEWSALKMRF